MKSNQTSNSKIKFINNIWITGIYNNKEIIGRCVVMNGKNSVTIVDEEGIPSIVLFTEIKNLFKINLINKIDKLTNNQKQINTNLLTVNKLLGIVKSSRN